MPIQNTNAILINNTQEELDQYVLVRNGVFNYIQILDDERDLFNSNGPLESKPNIVFYTENAETKVMLDYSTASDKDKAFLQILCKNLNDLSGLSLSDASYLNESQNIDKTFNLDLYFRQFKNNILFAKTTTSVDSNDLQKVFEGDYFISTPVLTSNSNWSNTSSVKNSLIVSVNPKAKTTFSSYYLQEGDLVEIINPNSANNNEKFEVLGYSVLNNKEILKLKTKAVNENLLGSSTLINIYAKTKNKNRSSNTLDKNTVGCCYSISKNMYFNNTTEYECDVRSNSLFQFTLGNCVEAKTPTNISTITVNSQVIETTKVEYAIFDSSTKEDLYISFNDNKQIMVNNTVSDVILLERGKVYKIIQDDSTNLGLPIRIARTPNMGDRASISYYYDSVFGTTNPEGIGSELYLKVTETTLSTLYLLTENDTSISAVTLVVV